MEEPGTEYYNRLLNCIDPAKDAMIKFADNKGLTNDTHGDFLKGVYSDLFNVDKLNDEDRSLVVGVGDRKEILKNRIDSAYKLNDYMPIQIIRQKFSGSGKDLRIKGFYLAQDAGIGLSKISSDFTLLLTPASVLDSASKTKKHTRIIRGLQKSKLSPKLLKELDISSTLKSIELTGTKNKMYNFVFTTSIPEYSSFEIDFKNDTFDEVTTDFFKGNERKNKYIYDNWDKDDKRSKNKLYILAKLMSDTLQVDWLKQMIEEKKEIQVEKTALCTNDINVWLRCIVNDVPSIITHGIQTTFYPIATTQAKKAARNKIHMEFLYNQLEERNNSVLEDMDLFYKYLYNKDICLLNAPENDFNANHREAIKITLRSVIYFMKQKASDILKLAPKIGDLEDMKKYVDTYMLEAPFLVSKKAHKVRQLVNFRFFLPKAPNRISFRPEIITRKISSGADFTSEDILEALADIPVVPNLPVTVHMDRMSGGGEDTEEYKGLYQKNTKLPGFLSFFVLTYLPELPLIAYAYGLALNLPLEKYKVFFDVTECEKICGAFGRIHDDVIDYLGGGSKETDTIMTDFCSIAAAAYSAKDDNFTIFDYAYKDLEWFLSSIKASSKGIDVEIHGQALENYNTLYNAELSLAIFNLREKVTPIEYSFSSSLQSGSVMSLSTPSARSMVSTPKASAKSSPKGSAKSSPKGSAKSSPKGSPKTRKATQVKKDLLKYLQKHTNLNTGTIKSIIGKDMGVKNLKKFINAKTLKKITTHRASSRKLTF
jgi:hypothetical protein